jgi:(4-O-methyl)-D-glucuronate---lignin esterase
MTVTQQSDRRAAAYSFPYAVLLYFFRRIAGRCRMKGQHADCLKHWKCVVFDACKIPALLIVASVLAFPCAAAGVQSTLRDPLADGFRAPPPAAEPRVWWHWMNGNVTKDGIRLDIEWMKRIGIGGMDAIDASIATPQVVKRRLVYMTPAWDDAFRYAARLANKFGMELAINSSPGWSETGGPWVTPQDAMKKLVWSTTSVQGGIRYHGILPQPPDNPGAFQNIPAPNYDQFSNATTVFYRDSIVIAYKASVDSPTVADVLSSSGAINSIVLSDGDLTDSVTLLPKSAQDSVWIRVAYKTPVQIQGLTLAVSTPDGYGYAAAVEVSDDDQTWRHVVDVPQKAQIRRFALLQQTISFPPVTGRYFRVVLRPAEPIPTSLRVVYYAPGAVVTTPTTTSGPRSYRVYELVFRTVATVNEFEKKAQFAIARDYYAIASVPIFAPGSAIDPANVIVLSHRMKPDGTLDWTPPPGRWIVLRMGYSLTGAINHPATPEATGLEVDKLSDEHVRNYLEHYLDTYEKVTGPQLFGGRGLQALTVDSAEIGEQNWTENILTDFRRLRGYDPTPWLPALTGAVVGSPTDSDKFLWDFRRTIAELIARNHYGVIGDVARERGLVNYGEALEDHRPGFGDDMEMRQFTSIPMGAMWTWGENAGPAPTYVADLRGAASVAHIYGQKLVAAESFTSAGQPWTFAPRELKPIADLEFALGVNRVVIHTSVHQPVDKPPGLSLFGYGQFFDRLESWADDAGPWIRYLARCSYLLQQGRYVADVAYFYGQEAPLTGEFGDKPVADVPQGFGFDFVNADAVEHELTVDHGDLVTKSGMHYRVLYLGGSSRMMTLSVLHRLADLAAHGAVLVGFRPTASPSLKDDPAQFQAAADALFGPQGSTYERSVGLGKVFPSGSLSEAFAALNLPPDFEYTKPEADTEVLYLHRRLTDGELYFITNCRNRAETVDVTFRVSGYSPELWDAVTGEVVKADFTSANGRTVIRLTLPAYGSTFAIFRRESEASSRATTEPAIVPVKALQGPWTITFQPHRGAPARIEQKTLRSWSDSNIPGVKYFSGTGTYTKTFLLPKAALKRGTRLLLDLGEVRELADISLNGKALGTVWTPPFVVDITRAAKLGTNVLKVKVTNTWVNRLIGDAQRGVRKRYTFTTFPTYKADAPLRVSGLLGPVLVRRVLPSHVR